METTHGVLELLLVSAEGLKHAHHLGPWLRSFITNSTDHTLCSPFSYVPAGPQRHYVTIQCGEQFRTSKITHGKQSILLKFEFVEV
jgi:hypothetical protein